MAVLAKCLMGGLVAISLAGPACAWEQQGGQAAGDGALRALPGGGLMLKDLPAQAGNTANLPGVNLNRKLNADSQGGNCASRDVNYFEGNQFRSGRMNECKFGNFSISTMGAAPSANYEPPPLFGNGPPPGSGGWARN